jgi:hypothetical protein
MAEDPFFGARSEDELQARKPPTGPPTHRGKAEPSRPRAAQKERKERREFSRRRQGGAQVTSG